MKPQEIQSEALRVLREGGTILYPTDTVWGLGCDATNPEAVAKIFEIKKRADSKSLVLLACDLDMVAKYVKEVPSIAVDLVEVNDAPMTIIYPQAICGEAGAPGDRWHLAHNAVAEDGSVGIRIPLMDWCVLLIFRRKSRTPWILWFLRPLIPKAPAKPPRYSRWACEEK